MSKGSRSGTMRKSASKRSFLSSDGSLGSNKAAHSGDILEAWEELFKHQMASIASILLKSSVVATAHDTDLLRTYVDKRAQEYVEEGLASLLPLDSLASSASSSSYQSRYLPRAHLTEQALGKEREAFVLVIVNVWHGFVLCCLFHQTGSLRTRSYLATLLLNWRASQ